MSDDELPEGIQPNRINLNTYLVGGLYALFAWVLVTVNQNGKESSAFGAKLDAYRESAQRTDRDMSELRIRLATVELDVARFKGRLP